MQFIKVQKKEELDKYLQQGAYFLNGVISKADVTVTGHFGNTVGLCLEINTEDDWCGRFMPNYNFTENIGKIIKAIHEALNEGDDGSVPFSSLVGKSCRVLSDNTKFLAIGHFMKDRWVTEEGVLSELRDSRRDV